MTDAMANDANGAGLREAMRAAAALKAEAQSGTSRKIGGLRALAELLGISPSSVSGWSGEIPLSRVIQIEAKTGVPRHILRPDHWSAPKPEATTDAKAAA